ncbi:hypothetical protein [Tessaracoccus sp. OH4464_COT-324]|uniref:hypothetical protein n=1 Tax=Tessaracoccus sp. OH4464_COT-324 TaxID=2491059 RepID=UPI000F6408C4|nr:hypothetical protein [Tessaracoccus sp. OH4464_COT-324]RRD44260.1 hypothetical protein EII42_11985 [Tessaracoccus sp. OH4464_COT-324]
MMTVGDAVRDGLSRILERIKQHKQGAPSSGADDYKKLAELLDRIEAERQRIRAEDERKSLSWWDKMAVFVVDVVTWGQARRDFDQQVARIKQRSDDGMAKLRKACERVLEEQDVPDDLKDKRDQWQGAAEMVHGVYETAPHREAIAGWEGPASEKYQEMAKVQTAACAEWSQLVKKMAEVLEKSYDINLVVQCTVYDQLGRILEPLKCRPGDREFFAPTAEFGNRLHACADWVPVMIEKAETAGGEMGEALRGVQDAIQVLTGKWPKGTEKSGTEPGNLGQGLGKAPRVKPRDMDVDGDGAVR